MCAMVVRSPTGVGSDQALLAREHSGFRAARHVELLVDRLDVVVDREPLDVHEVRDLLDREALAEVGQYLALAWRQAFMVKGGRARQRGRAAGLEARGSQGRVGRGAQPT